jgi:Asp-tRNA(Asn)/Glu-tRNA(Gln) amidotransferase A subunit family amidase
MLTRFRVAAGPIGRRSVASHGGVDFSRASLAELSDQLESGEVTATAVATWSLNRSAAAQARFNCLAGAPWRDRALAAAAASDARARAGKRLGPLDGVPVSVRPQPKRTSKRPQP